MANSFEKLKELDLSRDEVERIGEALKKPEFRKLLTDYVEEIQDPKNRKLYQEEITLLEKERGIDVTFIDPKPGYVIKTSVNGTQKAFVNICVNEHINKPQSTPTVKEGARGLSWSLPHSLSPPREDMDNKGIRCQVFDVVFHPDTLHLADRNKAFRTMVNTTALDAVEENFNVKLDKKNLKFPKLSYKGMPHASVIRKPSETKPEHTPEEKQLYDKIFEKIDSQNGSPVRKKRTRTNSSDDKSNYTTPKYVIKHRNHIDFQEFTEHRDAKMNAAIPKELIVEIHLPLLQSSADMTLDVTEKTVQLVSEKPAKYKLNLTLPYCVNESNGAAKFEKDLKKLLITLPVKRNSISSVTSNNSEFCDSGVESDHGSPGSPASEEEKHLVSELESNNKPSEHPRENSVESSTQFRTNFLDEHLHYNLPEFTCHVFENIIAFTLNVKNVDGNSVGKLFNDAGTSVFVKFTSIGSSFYPSHYAFFVKLPLHKISTEETTIEVWDNNVILQVPVNCDKPITTYYFGVNEENLLEKYVEEPQIINQVLQKIDDEKSNETNDMFESVGKATKFFGNSHLNNSLDESGDEQLIENHESEAIDILGTSYESSGDELSCSSFSPRKSKGILKRLSSSRFTVGRSISESSLDDYICPSSFENCHTSLESVIPENPEDGEVSTSLKKTVRFNDVVMRQLFRSNSSILGQKKKNQRKAQKKKRALERRHSESEASEGDDKKEGDLKDWKKEIDDANKKDDHDIFQLDIDDLVRGIAG